MAQEQDTRSLLERILGIAAGAATNPLSALGPGALSLDPGRLQEGMAIGGEVSEGISREALQPALGGLGFLLNRLPGGGRKLFSQEAEAPLTSVTREGFRQYLDENARSNLAANLSTGFLQDPLSYVGSPGVSGAGRWAAGVLPDVLKPVARGAVIANEAPNRFGEAVVSGGVQALTNAARSSAVGRTLIDNPRRAIVKQVDSLTNALRELASTGREAHTSLWEQAIRPFNPVRKLGDTANTQIKERMGNLEHQMTGAASPAQKLVMAELFNNVRREKDAIFGEVGQISASLLNDPALDDVSRQAMKNDVWLGAYNRVAALLDGADGAFRQLAERDWTAADTAISASPELAQRIAGDIQRATEEIRAKVVETSTAAKRLERTRDELAAPEPPSDLPKYARERLTAILGVDPWSPATRAAGAEPSPDDILSGLARVRDEMFRSSAEFSFRTLGETLDRNLPDVAGALGGATDELDLAFEEALATATANYGNLSNAMPTIDEALSSISPQAAQVLREHRPRLDRALASVASTRRNLEHLVRPHLASVPPEALAQATTSKVATRKLLLAQGADAMTIKRFDELTKSYGVLDPLKPSDTYAILVNKVHNQLAREAGLKAIVPTWWSTGVAMWKETATFASSFHLVNKLGILFFSSRMGVSPMDVERSFLAQLRQNAPDLIQRAVLTGRVGQNQIAPETMPLLQAYGRFGRVGQLARQVGRGSDLTVDLAEGGETAWGRAPVLVRYGLGAAGFGGGAIAAGQEDEDVAKAAVIGAATTGFAMPRLAALNHVIGSIIEAAARDTAYYTALEARHGAISARMRALIADFTPAVEGRPAHSMTAARPDLPLPPPVGRRATDRGPAMLQQRTRLGTPTTPPDKAALAILFEGEGAGLIDPETLRLRALSAGFHPEDANRLSGQWSALIDESEQAGVALSDTINFDYDDVPLWVDYLRKTGLMPFVTWQVKAAPVMATILAQDPWFFAAIAAYNQATKEDVRAAGLPDSYLGKVDSGLGNMVVEAIFGRPGAVYLSPFNALIPMMDLLPDDERPDYAEGPVEQVLAAGRRFGLNPSPLVTLPLQTLGVIDEQPGNFLRTSGYVQALSGLSGEQINPEAPVKEASRRLARALGAEREATVTGDPALDYAVNLRVQELYVEDTGRQERASGPYLEAMSNPESEIWQRAKADVERTRGAQTLVAQTLPVRPRFIGQTERDLREQRVAAGLTPADLAALKTAPTTADELAQAARLFRREFGRPAASPEELQEYVEQMRVERRYKEAERRTPGALALSSLGSSERDRTARAWNKYNDFKRRNKGASSKAQQQRLKTFLRANPDVAEVLRDYRSTLY